MNQELINFLQQFVTDSRNETLIKNINLRTRYLTVVLEDIFQPHNASAVLRTCDCFGVQDIHIIENENPYQVNPDIALGSFQWLTLKKYKNQPDNTLETIQKLKSEGYRIVATTPHTNDVNLEEFDLHKGKAAFFFGSEQPGLSQTVLNHADEFVKIPMFGFTESFNISVSVAIILHHLIWKLRDSQINWQLHESEKQEILLQWLLNSIKKSDLLVKEFYRKKQVSQ